MMSAKGKTIYLHYLFLLFFLLLLFPGVFFQQPQAGQEASRDIAIHLGFKYHLVSGKDLRLPDGPLGILHSRLPIAVNLVVYLLYDLYFLVTLFFILRNVLRERFHPGVVLFIFLAFSLTPYEAPEDWLFLFSLYYLFAFLRKPQKYLYLVLAAFPAIIGFYCRFDIGMPAIMIFVITVTYALIRKKLTVKLYLLTLLLFTVATGIAGYLLHVNIGGYVSTGLQFLRDGTDVHYEASKLKDGLLFHLAMEITLCFLYWAICLPVAGILKKDLKERLDEIFVSVLILLSAGMYLKIGFVRLDENLLRAFGVVILLGALLYLYAPADRWRRVPILCCWLVLFLSLLAVNFADRTGTSYSRLKNASFLRTRLEGAGRYLSELGRYNRVRAELAKSTDSSNDLRQTIGMHTTDVIPGEISTIYFNGLHYNPRPVAQTFSAFNSYLDGINQAKYQSSSAPDYVLFSMDSHDQVFPFYGEARTKLALLDRYSGVGETGGNLILRNSGRHRLELRRQQEKDVLLGEDIPIAKDSGLQFSRFFIRYDLQGRISHLLDQPPGLTLTLTLEDGSRRTCKVTKPGLEDGIIVNKYVESRESFQLLMQSGGRLTTDVRQIRIDVDSPGLGFVPEIRMVSSFYRFREQGKEERTADSLDIAALFQRHRPVAARPSKDTTKEHRCRIEEFGTFSPFIRIRGWVTGQKDPDRAPSITPVLQSRDHFFELPVEQGTVPIPDTTSNGKVILATRFTSMTTKAFLPPGDYELGLISRTGADTGRRISFTGRHFLSRSNYRIEKSGAMSRDQQGDVETSYHIDEGVIWKGMIYLNGWAYLQTTDTSRVTTYVMLSSLKRTYRVTTDALKRADVAADSNRPSALYCGFTLAIPENELAKDSYLVGLELISRDGKHRSLLFTNPTLVTGVNDVLYPVRADSLPPMGDFLSGVDKFNDEKEFLYIYGWAIRDMKEVATSTIDLVFKSDSALFVVRANPDKRTDLKLVFKNGMDLDNAGFLAKVSKENMPPGKYQIGAWVHPKNGLGSVKFLGLYTVKE